MAGRKSKEAQQVLDQIAFVQDAMKRFRESADAESRERKEALDDFEFWTGKQWASDIKTARDQEQRPCLTINRVADLVARVVNEQRQKKPAIQISPVGSGADVETAKILEGVVRHIENDSDAEAAYESGYQDCVVSGKGYWRVRTRYESEEDNLQRIEISRIRNRFQVYFDPACELPDHSDARYVFVVEDMPREEYRAKYPNSKLASLEAARATGDNPAGWITDKNIRVAEYWYSTTTWETKTVQGVERRVSLRAVKCAVINAQEVLEEYDWPGKTIPIVPVVATDVTVDGIRKVWGLVRFAKDPARQYNYMSSAVTEAIGLAPKAPWVVAEGQIEGHEQKWGSANVRNWPYLEYKPTVNGGQPVPPPQRQGAEPPIQAMMLTLQQADADIKSVTGLQDPALGAPGPEQSSKAIVARQNQGAISTLTYSSALARAIRLTGRILLEVIPYIYDEPRVERIINPDGSSAHAALFNSAKSGLSPEDALALAQEYQAVERIYDVGVGRYDVSVSVGPSYQSRRQEAATGMMTLINSFPQIVPVAGDLMVKNLDWPGAQELAERMKKILPPQLQDGNDPAAQAATLAQQLQQATALNQELSQKLQAAEQTILARKVEADSRERIAQMQANAQIIVQGIKSRMEEAQAAADREMQTFELMHESAHDQAMAATGRQIAPQGTTGIPAQ